MRIVALVPMRHHSERIPGKNYRNFAGLPLYHHILISLLNCHEISQVVIDTDSHLIRDEVAVKFPQIHLIDRPDHLRSGMISMNEILLYDVAIINADFYLQTHSTNPLLKSATISDAINLFLKNQPTYDSLFSVNSMRCRLWNSCGHPVNHNPAYLQRTQDLQPIYEENSNIYIFSRQGLKKKENRVGNRPLIYEMDRFEGWDIDEEMHFQIAEFLFLQRQRGAL